jgi:uncharacterized protein (DUF697 family)/predicted GTPase
MFDTVRGWFRKQGDRHFNKAEFDRQREQLLQRTPVPVFWLFGKTGSGKTSIIKYLTGAKKAEIGSGYRPQTQYSQRFAFPSAESPILEFLDTRGVGESGYDPAEDIAAANDTAHLMIVTARMADHALNSVLKPLKTIRKARPDRPVVLALTCLHDLYPQQQHPNPDPFEVAEANGVAVLDSMPDVLRRSLEEQSRRFSGLVDEIVPVDLTKPGEGFDNPVFGGDRLKAALVRWLPDAYRQTFLTMTEVMESLKNLHEKRAMPYVLSASTMAASAAAVPLPWIDIPVVMGVQSDLIRRLAALYGQNFDAQQFLQIAGAVGGRLVLRQIVRESLKIIPGVGQAANAALAFAATYALGRACCWYFGEKLMGHAPTREELQAVMKDQTAAAQDLWKKHHAGGETL